MPLDPPCSRRSLGDFPASILLMSTHGVAEATIRASLQTEVATVLTVNAHKTLNVTKSDFRAGWRELRAEGRRSRGTPLLDRRVIPSHAQSFGREDSVSLGAQVEGNVPGGHDRQDPGGAGDCQSLSVPLH